MIKVLSLAGVVLFSSIAVAGYSGQYETRVSTSHMVGDAMQSRDAAFAAGKNMLMDVNDKSAYELSKSMPHTTHDVINNRSYKVLDSDVTIKEVITNNGDVAYQPVLNVKYSYQYRDHNNRD